MIAIVSLVESDLVFEGPLEPTTEWRFHRDILRARRDVNAVVHTHPLYATTLSDRGVRRQSNPLYRLRAVRNRRIVPTRRDRSWESAWRFARESWSDYHGLQPGQSNVASRRVGGARQNLLTRLAGRNAVLPDDEIVRTIERFKNYGLKPPRHC